MIKLKKLTNLKPGSKKKEPLDIEPPTYLEKNKRKKEALWLLLKQVIKVYEVGCGADAKDPQAPKAKKDRISLLRAKGKL